MGYRSHHQNRRGRGQWHNHRQSNVTREIPIPNGSEGMIIGQRGSHIKELQGLPGIDYVRLDDGKLKIGGSSTESVDAVEFRVRDKLNKSLFTSGKRIRQIHFDLDHLTDRIEFIHLQKMGLVSFNTYSLQAEPDGFYVMKTTGVPQCSSLENEFSNLSLNSTGKFVYKDKFKVSRLVKNTDVIVNGFKKVLEMAEFRQFANINTEIRFTGTAFHHITNMRRNDMPIRRLLEDPQDYRTQFSVSLNIPSATLKGVLEKQGFEVVDSDAVTIVHLIDVVKATSYRAVFVEDVPDPDTEGSVDKRLTKDKKEELERISRCSRAEEILQVPSNSTKSVITKSYKKKYMLVHPDKNGFPGAIEAAKYVGNARDDLINNKKHEYKPPLFAVGEQNDDLPKLIAFDGERISHLLIDTVKGNQELGCRIAMTTKDPVNIPRAVNFLEIAWKNGEIVTGGKLSIDQTYSIEAVRIKTRQWFTDGEYDMKLEVVNQKATESCAKFYEFPELVMTCPALNDTIEVLKANPDNSAQQDTVLQIFRDYIERADELAKVIGSDQFCKVDRIV